MTKPKHAAGRLIAVDGINGKAITAAAKKRIAAISKRIRGGVSLWDASGIFDDLIVADEDAGHPSARTLVLLYAADLSFRLRWEIRPAIAEGKTVAAAPYVLTGVAFGRAAGLPAGWLRDVFAFAMRPDESHYVSAKPSRATQWSGFVEYGCERLSEGDFSLSRNVLVDRARKFLVLSSKF